AAGGRRLAHRRGQGLPARPPADRPLPAFPRPEHPTVPLQEPGDRARLRGAEMMRKIALLAAALAIATPAFAAPDAVAVKARLDALRARVELLKDHDQIENLQTAYGFYFDKSLWSEVADLFADDGSFEYGQIGVYVG